MKKIFLNLIKYGFIGYALLAVVGLVTQLFLMPFEFINVAVGAFNMADSGMAGLHPMAMSIVILLLSLVYIIIIVLMIKFGPAILSQLGSVLSSMAPGMAKREALKKVAGQGLANKISNSKLGRRAGLNGFGAKTSLEGLLGDAAEGLGKRGKKDADGKPIKDGEGDDKSDKELEDIKTNKNVRDAKGMGLESALNSTIDDLDRRGGKKDDATSTAFDPSGTIKSPNSDKSALTSGQSAEIFGAPFGPTSDISGNVTADALQAQVQDEKNQIENSISNIGGLGRSGDTEANIIGQRNALAADSIMPPAHHDDSSPAAAAISAGVASAALGGFAHSMTSQELLDAQQRLGANYIQGEQLAPELRSIGGTSVAPVPSVADTARITTAAATGSPVIQPSAAAPPMTATQIITQAVGGNGDISGSYYTPDASLTQMAQGASEPPRSAGAASMPQGSYLNQMVGSIGDNPAGTAALGAALGSAIIGSMNTQQAVPGGDAAIRAQARALSDAMASEYAQSPGFDANDKNTWSSELGGKFAALQAAMTGALTAQTYSINRELRQNSDNIRNATREASREAADNARANTAAAATAATTAAASGSGSASSVDLNSEGIRDVVSRAISRISEAAMAEADERAGNRRFTEDPENRRSVRDAIQGRPRGE